MKTNGKFNPVMAMLFAAKLKHENSGAYQWLVKSIERETDFPVLKITHAFNGAWLPSEGTKHWSAIAKLEDGHFAALYSSAIGEQCVPNPLGSVEEAITVLTEVVSDAETNRIKTGGQPLCPHCRILAQTSGTC